MARDFAREIAQKESELKQIETAMEATANAFIAASARFLSAWFPAQAKREVEKDSDTTTKLEPAQLSSLKRDVEALAQSADATARKYLDVDAVWWHRGARDQPGSPSVNYFTFGRKLPDVLDQPLRYAMGALAGPLEARGYLKPKGNHGYNPWRKTSGGSSPFSSLRGVDVPYFSAFGDDWPDDLRALSTQYYEQHSSAGRVGSELRALQEEKKKSEAGSLWDSA